MAALTAVSVRHTAANHLAGKRAKAVAPARASAATLAAPVQAAAGLAATLPTGAAHLLRSQSVLLGNLVKLGDRDASQPAETRKLGDLGAPQPAAWPRAADVLATDRAQDVAAAMILCEAVYRAVDFGEEQAEVAIHRLQQQLPAAPQLMGIQWSPPQQEQRYVVADTGDALVVAFLGTKRAADHLVNLHLRHTPILGLGSAAHSGYLRRAAGIPAEQLYQLARVQGKRLVLAGHSLGGAVATLCAVRLLDALPAAMHPSISCIGFAVPPVGNPQLAAAAAACGWQQRICNYVLPEDWVPGLLGRFARHQAHASSSAAAAGSSGGSGGADWSKADAGAAHERFCWGHGRPGSRAAAAAARTAAAAA